MKVKELIDILKALDPEAVVITRSSSYIKDNGVTASIVDVGMYDGRKFKKEQVFKIKVSLHGDRRKIVYIR